MLITKQPLFWKGHEMTIPTVPISMKSNKNSKWYCLRNVTGVPKNFCTIDLSAGATVDHLNNKTCRRWDFFSIPETIVVPVTFFRLPRQGKTIVLDLPLALHTSPYHAAAVGVIFHVPLSHGLPREWGQGTSAPMIKPAVNLKLCLEATTSNV